MKKYIVGVNQQVFSYNYRREHNQGREMTNNE